MQQHHHGAAAWSSSTPALFLAAWAKVYEASINPCSKTSQDMIHLAENVLANLPPDAFDSSSLLAMNQLSPVAVDQMVESN